MSVEENKKRLDRHEKVIEKLIDKVAQLEIARNIDQINKLHASNQDDKEDFSDSSLRS